MRRNRIVKPRKNLWNRYLKQRVKERRTCYVAGGDIDWGRNSVNETSEGGGKNQGERVGSRVRTKGRSRCNTTECCCLEKLTNEKRGGRGVGA